MYLLDKGIKGKSKDPVEIGYLNTGGYQNKSAGMSGKATYTL